MAKEHRAELSATGRRFAIVASRYSRVIVKELVAAAVDCLERHGAAPEAIEIFWVPGCFEIPLAARAAAESGRFGAVLALGLILKGETSHHETLAAEVASGISRVMHDTQVPVALGVVTAETVEQAWERAGIKSDGHGWQAALSAIEMASLLGSMRGTRRGGK